MLPVKKFVIQWGSRTTCEFKEPLHKVNTNEILSLPQAESCREERRRRRRRRVVCICLKKIRVGSPALC